MDREKTDCIFFCWFSPIYRLHRIVAPPTNMALTALKAVLIGVYSPIAAIASVPT